MSDANRSTIAYIAESTWGTTPGSPSFKKMRITGESLMHEKTTVLSEEIRDDRQNSDLVQVAAQASGSVDFELSYLAFQPFLAAALCASIVVLNVSATADIEAGVAATQTLTLSGNLSDGALVVIDGFAYRAKATPVLPFDFDIGADASGTLDNLIAAINGGAGSGTAYAAGTPPHPTVTAAAGAGDTMDVTARFEGTAGNLIAVSEDSASASWGAALLAGGTEPTISGTAGDFDDILVGTTVKVAGSATSANNGLKLVTGKAVNGSELYFASGAFTADTSTESLTLTGNHLRNGIERKSFSLERRILNSDGFANYQAYRGMMIDSLELNFESRAIVTGSMGFLGRQGYDLGNQSLDSDQAYTEADAGDVVNATSHVGGFLFNRKSTSERFKTLSLSIANNLRGKDAIGEFGNFDVGMGSFEVTGTLNAYFRDRSIHREFINHSDIAFSYQVTDPDGNVMVVTVPRAKQSTGTPAIEAKDTDVMVASEFTAIRDETAGCTLIIDFHPAA